MNNCFDLLAESLDLKLQVLKDIESYNEKQRKAFEANEADMDSFDEAIEQKEELINRLEKLDDGFESLYKDIETEIKTNKEKYASQIKILQSKIAEITDLSVSVQASEARNKKLVEQYFVKSRQGVKAGRVSSKVAYDYYKNMSGAGAVEAQFLDSKN